jgi:hypothetical protein
MGKAGRARYTADGGQKKAAGLAARHGAVPRRTSGHIQTENYGFKVSAVPSALLNEFSGHFTVQIGQIYNIGSLFHGHITFCQTRGYA